MNPEPNTDWRTIVALNAVSTLSQIGQFGIGIVLLPIWLVQHGLNASQLGVFASAEWLGMLAGLAIAPRLGAQFSHRTIIAVGLLLTIFALALIPNTAWPAWLPAAALIGIGMGLRWIGLEPWLYRIAPGNARGRLVGFHETLIGLAPIIAPALAAWVGITGNAPFMLGIAFTAAAFFPLAIARSEVEISTEPLLTFHPVKPHAHGEILALGAMVALIGGISEAAFSGLFPIFAAGRSFGTEQMVTLLSVFGLGGLLLQYLVGWLADHRGLVFTTSVCASGTAVFAAIASLPLGFTGFVITIFALGGFITAYLTLAIIAATKAGDGDLSVNVRLVSMVYTASSIFGPLIAGTTMRLFSSEALIWQIAVMACVLCGYIIVKGRNT